MVPATRTFRIFVSSTFSDLREERNALQRHVFPRLQRLCLAHGTRFQAIDLRWGVRDEAGLDQRTMRICLDEIDRCRRASPRPNFVVLLGGRYGWRPLPAVIPAGEFERLIPHIAAGADHDLIGSWYLRDDNAVPPEYCLKPREIDTGEAGTQQETEAAQRHEADRWAGIERSLRRILAAAAARALLDPDHRAKYEASATEQEINNGALKVSDASEHVFCYFRDFGNRDDLVCDLSADSSDEHGARHFIDTREDGTPDPEARERLQRLEATLARTLPDNVRRYRTRWVGRHHGPSADAGAHTDDVMDALVRALADAQKAAPLGLDAAAWRRLRQLKDEELTVAPAGTGLASPTRSAVITLDHLPALCADVFLDLAQVMMMEIARLEVQDPLDKEVDAHEAFGEDRSRVFIGREPLLRAIARYAAGDDSRPLAMYGSSGSGKSAALARATAEIRRARPDAVIIQRFIGVTPESSNVRTLLDGLCRQISRLCSGDEATIPTDYHELAQELPKRLALATVGRPLVVVLDALDQLSDVDRARNLTWLPAVLPAHARLIVSTLPGDCLSAIERKLTPDSRIEIDPMPPNEASDLLDLWLKNAGRTLQPDQRREVLESFMRSVEGVEAAAGGGSRGGLPLYLKLAFEEARRWRSGAPLARLGADVPGIIRDLFARLSGNANHGAMMVSRSLAYLAAAKNGLSEDELLDVLTLDDEAFADFEVRARHRPPERRLPVVVWSRLFFDLEAYLAERAADGASLLAFYHRQLRDVAEQDYLSGEAKVARHRVLARYFAEAALFEQGGRTPNLRKLSELPYQETRAELWEDLHKTLTDFEFLEAKCTHVAVATEGGGSGARTVHGGVYELQEDYRRALEVFPDV